MANLLDYSHFHLVGLKGVAMTALAQCLVAAGKTVTGSDVAHDFVTKKKLAALALDCQIGFTNDLPVNTDCVVYTSAHGGILNPQVQAAQLHHITTMSHAQALGDLFNDKQGLAVCGVGGKSTTSAMITWILHKTGNDPSFAIGVGDIPGLEKTGDWRPNSPYFVAEADEYVTQPPTGKQDWQLQPRFSFLKPQVTVCTNLKYDHPDVYKNFAETRDAFHKFFQQIKPGGALIFHDADTALIKPMLLTIPTLTFGESESADFRLRTYSAHAGQTQTEFTWQKQNYQLILSIPGKFNALNALAALAVTTQIGIPLEKSLVALQDFHSTQRRFEFKGEKNGVKYYDDYAHHPNEVAQTIQALNEWYPEQRKVIAFQSHTFSRTKELFNEFLTAFSSAQEVVMIDIFASARESADPSISSTLLCESLTQTYPQIKATNLKNIPALAQFCREHLHPGDIFITVGAGDIYEVHDLI